MSEIEQGKSAPATPELPSGVRAAVYGRNYSYFSHRIFVAFMPEDLHKYLHDRLTQVDTSGAAIVRGSGAANEPAAQAEAIDLLIVRWVLLHRSQLNALALNRELESWRGSDDRLRLPPANGVRSDEAFRLDITLQIAVEIALSEGLGNDMLKNRPRLQLALLDAAYFVSRRRAEQDRAQDAPSTGPAIDIDLSESGRTAFELYLVQRMNLDEDKVASQPGATTDAARAGVPQRSDVLTRAGRGPLSVKEVNWLHGVAIGVARTLSAASSDAASLQVRWNNAFKERWDARDLPLPDLTPFEAALTGKSAPLEAIRVPAEDLPKGADPETTESFRYRWRVTTFADKPWAKSLMDIAKGGESSCRFIEWVDALLRRVMWGSEAAASPTSPLDLLSNRYRLLPATPAWAAVAEAITRMREARIGTGDTASLVRHGRVLEAYVEMLRPAEAARAVGMMLICGATLAGLQAGARQASVRGARGRPQPEDWTVALNALHDGLRLDNINVEAAGERLGRLYAELVDFYPHAHGPSLPPVLAPRPQGMPWASGGLVGGWPLDGELDAAVVDAYSVALAIGQDPRIRGRIVAKAWFELRVRLRSLASGHEGILPAHASEIACAMLGVGPGPMLPLRVEQAGARRWTEVLIDTLVDQKTNGEIPVALAAHALERLGMRTLQPHARRAVLQELSLSEDRRTSLDDYAGRHALWRSGGLSVEGALVVGPALESLAEGWPLPPTGGLVLAVADINLKRFESASLGRVLDSSHMQWRVAFEPWFYWESETESLEAWVDALKPDKRPLRLWLYRAGRVGAQRHKLINPGSADELWNWGPPPNPGGPQ